MFERHRQRRPEQRLYAFRVNFVVIDETIQADIAVNKIYEEIHRHTRACEERNTSPDAFFGFKRFFHGQDPNLVLLRGAEFCQAERRTDSLGYAGASAAG